MRRIEETTEFKKDFKREARGNNSIILSELLPVLVLLATDKKLPEKHRDHALAGDKKDLRDCHIRPNLILLYRKEEKDILRLVRIGSHSELDIN